MQKALRSAAHCTSLHIAYKHARSLSTAQLHKQRCHCTSPAAAAAGSAAAAAAAEYLAPAEEHLQHLAALLARDRRAGDCYCLYGSVGAGKSVFSRAFIRAAAQDPTLPVPSPTYLLQLIYEEQEGPPIHHFDLYRLDSQQDMSRLDLAASFSSAVSLVEWADRMPPQLLPQRRLEVHIRILEEDASAASSSSSGSCSSGDSTSAEHLIAGHTPDQQQQQQQQQQVQATLHQGQKDVLLLPTSDLQQQQQQDDLLQSVRDTGDEEFEEAEDEYEELFTDKRQRLVRLGAFGKDWAERVQQLAQHMQ
uniref:tRNA threonylcarbamoyladenosine biosynthesis protein TsaE n=1 Tax=Tetradesmus obliquus TaxID=3088 RepID=A0A383VCJ7_TETOB|eukprot:jgi/Sobl393_1/15534/SZX62364.1